MNLLNIENMSKTYTERQLFNSVSLGVGSEDKIGVVGINGTGKSTLLKIIAGLEELDDGTMTKANIVSIAYLPQSPYFDASLSILENVLLDQKVENEYHNIEGEAIAMLAKLSINDPHSSPDLLSGGQKKRAALVKTLLSPSNLLILDEPTNHLDHEMTEWLENYLKKYKGAFIMVTHDRYFLDNVSNKIIEIDKGKLYTYNANYTEYILLKAERESMATATERKNKSLYKTELEWMMRGPRARSTKQKAHIKRFEELRDRETISADETIEIRALSKRLGKKTIIIDSISKSYESKKLFDEFTYTLLSDDRIGVVGKNGCGKSTLLKIICGQIKPDTGWIEVGETVNIGFFSQENEALPEDEIVIEYLRETADYVETKDGKLTASQLCEQFLFSGTMQHTVINKLSGGEKRRLFLLKILMKSPNVLILDEPTNDLDIQTLTILEEYLNGYDGIVISVSHDRYFLDKMAKRIFAFEDNLIQQYEGNYSDYKDKLDALPQERISSIPKTETQKSYKPKSQKLKFSYHEEREYQTIDQDIETLEKKITELEEKISTNATNYEKLTAYSAEKEEMEHRLEKKMERWVYLNELKDTFL